MNVVEALRDPQLLGGLGCFKSLDSWGGWIAILKAVEGLPLDGLELEWFQRHTGRRAPRPGGFPETLVLCGRQSGKSQMAGAIAAFEAATAPASARGQVVVLVAQDQRSSQRTLFGYVKEAFDASPLLRGEVARQTELVLELVNGVTVAVYPCRPQATRGVRARLVIVDEVAHFISSDGRPTDVEMVRALRPALAMTGGRLLILTSPYAQAGLAWELCRRHWAKDESPTLVVQASATDLNALLPEDYLARMREDDPEAYRSEVLGEFRQGLSTLFDFDVLDECVARGVHEVPPAPGTYYSAHFDASGGRTDAAGLAVGHVEGSGLARVDLVRRWPAPHNPEAVAGEAADVLKRYGVWRVQVDRFGGEFPIAAFRRFGVVAEVAPRTTSEHHLAMLPLVNCGGVVLPDVPEMLKELRGLERRTGTGGRDRVDHRRGAHDDLAAAVSGVVSLLAGRDPSDLGITIGNLR